jgi:phasin family protein
MTTSNPFDFTKAFEQFDPKDVSQKIQDAFNFDYSEMKVAQDKNLALLMSTNQTLADSSQAFFERQAEMLQQAMTEATEAAKSFASAGSPQDIAAKQAELLQAAYEKALANSTEISEMAQKTQAEINDKVNKRIEESMEEFKETLSKIV